MRDDPTPEILSAGKDASKAFLERGFSSSFIDGEVGAYVNTIGHVLVRARECAVSQLRIPPTSVLLRPLDDELGTRVQIADQEYGAVWFHFSPPEVQIFVREQNETRPFTEPARDRFWKSPPS
jgi:hypothetical protein